MHIAQIFMTIGAAALTASCANLPNNTLSQIPAYVQPNGAGTTSLLIRVNDVFRAPAPIIYTYGEPLTCAQPQRVSVASKTEGGSYPSAVVSNRLSSISYVSVHPTTKAACIATASFVGKPGVKYLVSAYSDEASCRISLTDITKPESSLSVDTYYPRLRSARPTPAQGFCVPETLAQYKQKYPTGNSLPGASSNSAPKDARALDGFEALLPK
jgi:hypothetical protein